MVKTVVPVLVLVLVATVMATNPPAQPASTSVPGSPVAGASPTVAPDGSPSGSTAPTLPPEPWEDLVLCPIQVVAALSPLREDRTGVDPRSRFKLRSLGDTPAVDLARARSSSRRGRRSQPAAIASSSSVSRSTSARVL
jgi:hypothetical protein